MGDADKMIIWARFHADLQMLARVAIKMGIKFVEFSGRVSERQGEHNRIQFIEDDRTRLFIGTTETGGESLNLQVASRTGYFSNSYNWGKRAQSERRTWRAGQERPCWYIDVVGFPIDRLILHNHKEKRDMAQTLKTVTGLREAIDELGTMK